MPGPHRRASSIPHLHPHPSPIPAAVAAMAVLIAVLLAALVHPWRTSAAIDVEANITAVTSGVIASDWTAVYYPSHASGHGAPLVIGNDGGAASGGVRGFHLDSLAGTANVLTGRTKLATVLHGVAGVGDVVITIAQPDSVIRALSVPSLARLTTAPVDPLVALGDWNAICPWRSPAGDDYVFLFGKGGRAFQYLVRGAADGAGVEVLEVRAIPVEVVFVGCAVSQKAGRLYLTEDVDQDVYEMVLDESVDAPRITKVAGVGDATGIAVYAGVETDAIFVAQESVVAVYTTTWDHLGTVTLAGYDDIEIQGLSIHQPSTALHPAGALIFAIEADGVEGFGTLSLAPVLSALSIPPNTAYTPRTTPSSPSPICPACSHSGFCRANGTCGCFLGSVGANCALPQCTASCSDRGRCVGPNVCVCNPGWGGLHCSFLLVEPSYETDEAGGDGDDPAVWISPLGREHSRVIVTVKSEEGAGLNVFDLQGHLVQNFPAGQPNNVDVIYGFDVAGRTVDLTFAGCRTDDTMCLFEILPNGTLTAIPGGSQPLPDSYSVYGSCVYRSPRTSKQYLFVNEKSARYLQYELTSTPSGSLQTTLVRDFTGGSGGQVEGCVVDEANGWLFLGEEPSALWRYDAEPDSTSPGVKVAYVGDGTMNAEVEGVTLVLGKTDDAGYVLVSNQGVSSYNVYRRAAPHEYVATFTVTASADGRVDAVSNTDGIAAVGTALGPDFPHGLVVVHDDANELPGGGTSELASFKLVSLAAVLGAEPLKALGLLDDVDADWDPRAR